MDYIDLTTLVNDSKTFDSLKVYMENYLNNYLIQRVRDNKDTDGLHHSYTVLQNCMAQMQKDFGVKKEKRVPDQSR